MKKDMQEHYTYTDCDIIEDQATNKDFTFIIPYFQNSHYISIVRQWIDNKIYFLYNDSVYKTERTLIKTSSAHIPYEVFAFLMNSPLWPEGETVHWIRVPSVTQEEDECGFRTLLHTYLLVMSEYLIYSLIPLNYIGNKKLKSNHAFYKYAEKKLTTLCQQWIKDIMYSKRWKTTDWIKDVLVYKTDSYSSKIKDGNCLIMKCTSQYKEEAINIVREERNAEAAKVEAEKAKQRKLQTLVITQVETEQIEPSTEQHSEEQKSVMTQVESEQIEPTIEEHTEKQFDTATTDGSADKDYESSYEYVSNCSKKSDEDSAGTTMRTNLPEMPKTIAIITENTRLTRIGDETDEVNNNAVDAVQQNVAKASHEDDLSNVNFIPLVNQPTLPILPLSNKKPRK
jgi:hypothetical protein